MAINFALANNALQQCYLPGIQRADDVSLSGQEDRTYQRPDHDEQLPWGSDAGLCRHYAQEIPARFRFS